MGSTKHLQQHQFEQEGDEPLAVKPICVRFSASVDALLRERPDRSGFIRRAVVELIERERQ